MGFSLKKIVNAVAKPIQQIAKTVAPVAALVPGPIGAAAAGLTMAYAARKSAEASAESGALAALPGGAPIPDYGPLASGGYFGAAQQFPMSALGQGIPSVMQAGFPAGGVMAGLGRVGSMLGGMGRSLIPGAGAIGRAAAGVLRSVGGKIRGVVLASGRFVSSKKAAALAKRVGIDAAAAALGVSAVELAEMVLSDSESKSRRRNRGVSGADLRRTRRTIRKVESMHRYIVQSCHSAHVPRRSSAPRRVVQVVRPGRDRLISVK